MTPQTVTFKTTPMGKPRMTRRDSWAKRPCVQRYWAFKDELNEQLAENVKAHEMINRGNVYCVDWVAYFPMPKSWTKKKKDELRGQRHQSKPDRDNVDKAILDALFKDDSIISDGILSKRWDDGGGARIVMTFVEK